MNRSRLLLLIPVLFVALIFSCKKNDDGTHTNVTPGTYSSLEDVYTKTAPVSRTASISVSSGGSLFSSGGTRIEFPRDAFQTYSGTLVTGSVQVTINDWILKGDMTFGKILPVSYNEPLSSSGEAYIHVTQNGIPLRLRDGVKVAVYFPQHGVVMTGDSLYDGNVVIGSGNIVNWLVDTGGSATQPTDSVVLLSDSLNYISSSHFFTFGGIYNNFKISINSPVVLDQTSAVAMYDNLRVIYPILNVTSGAVFATRVPSASMHVAVMGVHAGQFYGGIVPIFSPANDSVYQVDIKPVDPQAFRLQMNAL